MQDRLTAYVQRVSNSLGALDRCLRIPRIARRTIFALIAIHSGLLAYSAYVHSPTLNEPGHLVAGLSHWKFGRFDLFRVNPPLVRMVGAIPVMAVGHEEDWSGFIEGPGERPVSGMGADFVAANGERCRLLFMVARWACIPFSWIGGIVCYLWARDLYGRPAGVLACLLWCFSPNILAHASLITTDAHATALGVAACYTFWRWLKAPSWTHAALAGCVLGLAQLAKTTLILFYPLWPLLWILYRWPDRKCMDQQKWLREAGMLLLWMVIGLYLLNLGYGFEGSGKQLKEFHFASDLFTGNRSIDESYDSTIPDLKIRSPKSTNRFTNSLLGYVPTPFPKHYLLGIDIQQQDFENYVNPSYLRGKFRRTGWWWYYLYAISIKVPIGMFVLGFTTFASHILNPSSCERGRDELVLVLPGIIILAVVSFKTGFSEHMRYALPSFPFAFIWMSRLARSTVGVSHLSNCNTLSVLNKTDILPLTRRLVRHVAIVWLMFSSMAIYPHSLSYFNELVGGPNNGRKHLLHSNVDWGQDLYYLQKWVITDAKLTDRRPLYLLFFGSYDPGDLGMQQLKPLNVLTSNAQGSPSMMVGANDLRFLSPGLYAVSVNIVQGLTLVAYDGTGNVAKLSQNAFESINRMGRLRSFGYSILLFENLLN